jgi:glycosyltransferase involved in cell wall biosynthesis
MKVGYICSDVEIPVFGREGCSIHVREFIKGLYDGGHEAFLMPSWLGEAAPDDFRAPTYPIRPAGMDAAAWSALEHDVANVTPLLDRDLKSVLQNEWLQKQAPAVLERERPDFLYERYALFGWGGIALSRQYGLPLILEVNAPLCREQDGYERFTLVQTAKRMEEDILRGADGIVAVSDWIRDWLTTRGVSADRIMVLPNGFSAARFAKPADGAAPRRRHSLANGPVVGFVGTFQNWHDTSTLIRAFASLLPARPDLRLLLVGDGPQREELENMVGSLGLSPTVVFAGSVAHHEVPDYLAAMDVAAAPFAMCREHPYGSPMKLFEYMAAGRPTVAAALGQVTDLIDHGRTGWLYPPGDTAALAAGIEHLLAHPTEAADMGAAARKKAFRDHTWTAVAGRVVERARELLARKRSP